MSDEKIISSPILEGKVTPIEPKTIIQTPSPINSVVKPVLTPKKSVLAKIKLFKNHIHSGIMYNEGTVIEVDEASLRYIEEHKIGTRV